ncbi:MAG TPA: carboxymuconolactone decarboxylase family protein [Rhizomicrobium sp.]|nr:carboxymuconolactone decarboxylase family protein [Rhizomicrobium sp.]
MARIPYIDENAIVADPALIGAIKGGRGRLINIYKILLHAPALAPTWFAHINATRDTKLSGRMRELAIVRMAHNASYEYALRQHVPVLAAREGVTDAECAALKNWQDSNLFDEKERAALSYVDAMQIGPAVPNAVFDEMKRCFDVQELVELTIIVGTYIMHHRVFTTLGVDPEQTPSRTR